MQSKGFTLAELLIALAILGVIATFTIPKILTAQRNEKYNAITKEAVAMVTGAQQAARQEGVLTTADSVGSLIYNYGNYVRVDSTSSIDSIPGATSETCASYSCFVLHNGAIVLTHGPGFGGNNSTNATGFMVDPDGKLTDNNTNGPDKSVLFFLYYSGRVTTYDNILNGTVNAGGWPGGGPPPTQTDPTWLSWN